MTTKLRLPAAASDAGYGGYQDAPSDEDRPYWQLARTCAAAGALFRDGAERDGWRTVTEAARRLALLEYAANHDLPVVM